MKILHQYSILMAQQLVLAEYFTIYFTTERHTSGKNVVSFFTH